jgi:hypothetical protein
MPISFSGHQSLRILLAEHTFAVQELTWFQQLSRIRLESCDLSVGFERSIVNENRQKYLFCIRENPTHSKIAYRKT